MTKNILLYLLLFSLGAGSCYVYFRTACSFGLPRKNHGSIEFLRNRGVRSLGRLEDKLNKGIKDLPKHAGILTLLLNKVSALKGKFITLIPDASLPSQNNRSYSKWSDNRSPRYAEGSLDAIRSRGVSTLSMLEAIVDRRIYVHSEQSEATLMSLNNDIVELKQQFKALSVD